MVHKLEPKYQARLAQLEHLHPSAFRFLTRIHDQGPGNGLRLSTSTHAHIYRYKAFLLRIELEGRGRDRESLALSPKPHLRIEEDATDGSDLVFPKAVTDLVMRQGGYKSGWAPRGTAPDVVLTPSTPDAFFDALFDHLIRLPVSP